jgi:hypothetical protein
VVHPVNAEIMEMMANVEKMERMVVWGLAVQSDPLDAEGWPEKMAKTVAMGSRENAALQDRVVVMEKTHARLSNISFAKPPFLRCKTTRRHLL